MVNNFQTKAAKGSIGLMSENNRLKVNFPRQHFAKQVRKGLQLEDTLENRAKAAKIIQQLELELQDGKLHNEDNSFNEIRYLEILLSKGVVTLKSIQSGKTVKLNDVPLLKPQLGLLEIWERYSEYRKHGLRESHYIEKYCRSYPQSLMAAITATKSEDAAKIKNWLLENRNNDNVYRLLSNVEKAFDYAIKQGYVTSNPFKDITDNKSKGVLGKEKNEVEADSDVLDKSKAYTWQEAQIILDYCNNHKPVWVYNFLKFKFLTGCRTGEAIGFTSGDILWDREQILFRRTYNRTTKKFYPLKNSKGSDLIRIFPMPKNGELWALLRSIYQEDNNEVVFKSPTGKMISSVRITNHWKGETSQRIIGIIPTLIEQGKLDKCLSSYNTRHTFIIHQVFDLGRDEKIVSAWCGHDQKISYKHYQDISDKANQVNPELPANQLLVDNQKSELELLKKQLKQQEELINRLLDNNSRSQESPSQESPSKTGFEFRSCTSLIC